MKQADIQLDPRWHELKALFGDDLVAFAREVCGVDLTSVQERLLRLASKPMARLLALAEPTLMPSGDKLFNRLALIATWHLLCDRRANVVLPVPDRRQHYDELIRRITAGAYGWAGKYLRMSQVEISLAGRGSAAAIHFLEPSTTGVASACPGVWLLEDEQEIDAECMKVIMSNIHGNNLPAVLSVPDLGYESLSRYCSGKWDVFQVFPGELAQTLKRAARPAALK